MPRPEYFPITGYLTLYVKFTHPSWVRYASISIDFHTELTRRELAHIMDAMTISCGINMNAATELIGSELISKEEYEKNTQDSYNSMEIAWGEAKKPAPVTEDDGKKHKWVYETGVETPEIMGSGSSWSHVLTTTDEDDAFAALARNGRNYLKRTRAEEQKGILVRITEYWSDTEHEWVK